jgi:hypothetical protein
LAICHPCHAFKVIEFFSVYWIFPSSFIVIKRNGIYRDCKATSEHTKLVSERLYWFISSICCFFFTIKSLSLMLLCEFISSQRSKRNFPRWVNIFIESALWCNLIISWILPSVSSKKSYILKCAHDMHCDFIS